MQETIERILNGNFDSNSGSLDFSCTEIDISLHRGECYEGEFQVTATDDRLTNGFVTCSDRHMECLTPELSGVENHIAYCFHGENLEPGDVIKGFFYIVSNHGEHYIPFVVSVQHEVLEAAEGQIKNLFHFANLAKSDWQEAVRVFYSPEFASVFTGPDAAFYDCYRGLSYKKGQEQNVEEFLIRINKKQRMDFLADSESVEMDVLPIDLSYGAIETQIRIARNGWGYTSLNVECDGDFLFVEKQVLTDDDFLGNRCNLSVYIDGSCLNEGKNFGQVVLYNSYMCINIPVCIRLGVAGNGKKSVEQKKTVVQLMEYYRSFRMKKISMDGWLRETGKLVDQLLMTGEDDIAAKLFKSQILITEEKFNEAEWMLDQSAELLEQNDPDNEELYSYYLYLTTLIKRDEEYVADIAEEVDRIYSRNKASWRIAWLLLYLSEDYNKTALEKWSFLKHQFEMGCRSFIIYIEVLNLLNNNPALLRTLDDFEYQVLYFGAKQNNISDGVREQLIYLCSRPKDYHPVFCKLLMMLYEKKADTAILQAICTMLIKGGKTGKTAFKWYALGVEEQLRITNLYEYYMMSLTPGNDVRLPKIVLLYFSYQCNLDYERMAYLYHYVYENRLALGEIYETYRPRIERFVEEQIMKQHCNRYLAELYDRFLLPEMVDEKMAIPLSRLLFSHVIRVEDLRIHKLYVYQRGITVPREYSLFEGKTWVPLYGNDYTLIFEDGFGNRFSKSVEYTMEKMMVSGKHLQVIEAFDCDSSELDLYLYQNEKDNEWDSDTLHRAIRISQDENVLPEIRRDIEFRLMQFYYDADALEALDTLLQNLMLEEYDVTKRGIILKHMVLRGQYDLVFGWMEFYGPRVLELSTLVRLVSAMVAKEKEHDEELPALTDAAFYVFRHGKYNTAILEYLCRYFNGMVKDMRDIWKTALDFGVDCYYLTERILCQMLFSGAFVGEQMELFRYYVSQGAKQEIELAFIAQLSFDYFANEKVTDVFLFREMQNMYRRGEELLMICKLAYLKFYAEYPEEATELESPVICTFLQEMMDERIHLNFFRDLKDGKQIIAELSDKTIVEYRAHPGNRARIHYVILNDNGEAGEYLSEYMRDVYGGVYVKEFVLFFGETLQYYIVEEANGSEQLTESATVQKNDIGVEAQNTRYELINDMVISKTLQDYDTLDAAIETYYRREYYNEQLFALK